PACARRERAQVVDLRGLEAADGPAHRVAVLEKLAHAVPRDVPARARDQDFAFRAHALLLPPNVSARVNSGARSLHVRHLAAALLSMRGESAGNFYSGSFNGESPCRGAQPSGRPKFSIANEGTTLAKATGVEVTPCCTGR